LRAFPDVGRSPRTVGVWRSVGIAELLFVSLRLGELPLIVTSSGEEVIGLSLGGLAAFRMFRTGEFSRLLGDDGLPVPVGYDGLG
jgi:hypothetical protein